MMVLLAAMIAAGAVSQSTDILTASNKTLLVAPSGTQPNGGVVGLDAAATRLAADTAITDVMLLPGVYRPQETFRLANVGRRVTIRAQRAGTAIIDGVGQIDTAMLLSGQQIMVTGLVIRNYRMNGVVIGGGNAIAIVDNQFENIASHKWSQGAIHGSEVAFDIIVRGNTIRNVGYAAILFEASERGKIHDIRIDANTITGSCRNVPDCGAIYAQGRTGKLNNLVISGNHVSDFGPRGSDARAIYLDDGLSNAVVEHNEITGTGGFSIQIHGGSGNRILSNSIDVCESEGVLFYQDLQHRIMYGNIFRNNILRIRGGRVDALVKRELDVSPLLPLVGNMLTATCPSSRS